MDKFLHERNLEIYRLQLDRATDDALRNQLLRLIRQEKASHPPRGGQTLSDRSDPSPGVPGAFAEQQVEAKT